MCSFEYPGSSGSDTPGESQGNLESAAQVHLRHEPRFAYGLKIETVADIGFIDRQDFASRWLGR